MFWIGQYYNSFLPGGAASDAVRFGHLWRERPDRKAAAAASLIEDRLLGLGALLLLALVALGLLGLGADQPDRVAQLVLVFWAASVGWCLVGGLVWLVARPRETERA